MILIGCIKFSGKLFVEAHTEFVLSYTTYIQLYKYVFVMECTLNLYIHS